VGELKLPEDAKVICLYRDQEFILAESETKMIQGDEVVILTHSRNIPELKDRWAPRQNRT
jgi:trk system potassium uptake protein